jgi:hypothetical protein
MTLTFRNCKFKYIYIINTYNKPCQCVTFFIEVPVPRQESKASYICLLGVSILSLFASILIFDVGFIQTVWYFFIFILLQFIRIRPSSIRAFLIGVLIALINHSKYK